VQAGCAATKGQAAGVLDRVLVGGLEGDVLETVVLQHAGDAPARAEVPEQVVAVAEVVEQAVVGRRCDAVAVHAEPAEAPVIALEQQHAQAARGAQQPGARAVLRAPGQSVLCQVGEDNTGGSGRRAAVAAPAFRSKLTVRNSAQLLPYVGKRSSAGVHAPTTKIM
jgi:hypothetical protein